MAAPSRTSRAATSFSVINESRRLNTEYITDINQYFSKQNIKPEEIKDNEGSLQDLLRDFRDLLKFMNGQDYQKSDNKVHDVEFIIGDNKDSDRKKVYAHKQILAARSAIFDSIFKQVDEKKDIDEVLKFKKVDDPNNGDLIILEIPKEFELEDLEILLEYIYWGFINEDHLKEEQVVERLYKFAAFLDLKALRKFLADCLKEFIVKGNPGKVVHYLKLADEQDCKYLKNICIKYIVENKKEVLETSEWKDLHEPPNKSNDNDNSNREKIENLLKDVFKAIVKESSKK